MCQEAVAPAPAPAPIKTQGNYVSCFRNYFKAPKTNQKISYVNNYFHIIAIEDSSKDNYCVHFFHKGSYYYFRSLSNRRELWKSKIGQDVQIKFENGSLMPF